MEEIRLVPALGEFRALSTDYLPFDESDLNLVIDYDISEHKLAQIAKLIGSSRLPQKDESNRRVFYARPSESRGAIIDSKYFERRVNIPERQATGLKIKGCRYLDLPPFPVTFVTPKSEVEGLEASPEIFTAYKKDGTPFEGYKDQPFGMTVKHAEREVIMSLAANFLEIPTNMYGIGTGKYSGMIFNGFLKNKQEPMGTAQFLLTRNDDRVSQLVLDHRDSNFSSEDALEITSRLKKSAYELNTDVWTLIYDHLFEKSGRLLSRMHSSGFVHGPRQSHYMNYIVPNKQHPELAVCDFESSMLVSELTDKQAICYMTEDLANLASSAENFQEAFTAAILKCTKEKLDIDDLAIGKAVDKVKEMWLPLGDVVRGYVGDFDDLRRVVTGPKTSLFDIVEKIRKDDLKKTRKELNVLDSALHR